MWLLQRALEWIDHTELIVLAFPAKWTWCSPRLDDQVMRFAKTLAIVDRVSIGRPGFDSCATHEARDKPSTRDHINLREFFCKPQRVIENRQWIPEQHDLRVLCR